ncbi:MAG: hypothetical protein H3C27_14930 [Opitutaceae bacterium]|nr:hypothetical protein [Opitutaceae bacterium]
MEQTMPQLIHPRIQQLRAAGIARAQLCWIMFAHFVGASFGSLHLSLGLVQESGVPLTGSDPALKVLAFTLSRGLRPTGNTKGSD